MKTLRLPNTFVHSMDVQSIVNNKLVTTTKVVTSKTSAISYPYSGPLYKSFNKDTASPAKVLDLAPDEVKDFSDDEAEVLLANYPFLEVIGEGDDENLSASKKAAMPTHENVEMASAEPSLGESELPSNFMLLKKHAVNLGCDILKSDKKEDILRKIQELNS